MVVCAPATSIHPQTFKHTCCPSPLPLHSNSRACTRFTLAACVSVKGFHSPVFHSLQNQKMCFSFRQKRRSIQQIKRVSNSNMAFHGSEVETGYENHQTKKKHHPPTTRTAPSRKTHINEITAVGCRSCIQYHTMNASLGCGRTSAEARRRSANEKQNVFARHAFASLCRTRLHAMRGLSLRRLRSDGNLSIYLFYFIRVNVNCFHWLWFLYSSPISLLFFFLLLVCFVSFRSVRSSLDFLFFSLRHLRYLAIRNRIFFPVLFRLSHQHISHSIVLS